MAKPQPEQSQLPVVQRLRVRYAKRGPLRFTSHRDFARAFERAIRRAGLPIAFSQGFTPHPRISYASAAPTGAASEAEYLEIGLNAVVDPQWARAALDAALPPGLDVLAIREAPARAGAGEQPIAGLPEKMNVSRWRFELPGLGAAPLEHAVAAFLAADEVLVERLTKQGRRRFDARHAVVTMVTLGTAGGTDRADRPVPGGSAPSAGAVPDTAGAGECAMMEAVVRQVTPAVRPDDVLAGLRVVADLVPPVPARVTRLAQGTLTPHGEIADPLADDGEMATPFVGVESAPGEGRGVGQRDDGGAGVTDQNDHVVASG
ncbi:MAG TPA: TIGR03936 family radical SAM-associated protein [Micromonosporaceae bacterium]|jgi:radical SAM-linked protein